MLRSCTRHYRLTVLGEAGFCQPLFFALHKIDFLFIICYTNSVAYFYIFKRRYSMNTVAKRRFSEKELRGRAQDCLIAEQKCSKHRDNHYTIICYGPDINTLDPCRRWIYDEEVAVHGNPAMAQITANKMVLYINASDLNNKMRELREIIL